MKNKVFFFVSYEGTRDHRVVDTTVTIPTPSMLRGDFSGSDLADLRSAHRECGRHRAHAVPGVSGRPELRAVQHRDESAAASTSFPRRGWIRSRRRSRATFPPTTSTGTSRNYFVPGPVRVRPPTGGHEGRLQREFQVQPGRYVRSSSITRRRCPPCSVTRRSGEPIGGSSNPGHGHGNIYRFTDDGHLHLQPDVPHGRALWMGQAGDELGAAGPRHEHRERRAGHSGHQRHAPLRERLAHVRVRGLRHRRRERELHAVLPARSAVAVRRELQLAEEQAQHPVRRRLLSHGAEPCAGGVHHRRLRRAGRLRVRPRHHASGARLVDPATGNCQQTSDGSRSNSAAAFVLGQASRAGRTLQVPDEYQRAGKPVQLLHPRPVDHRRQPHARLRHAVGVLPASDPTRPRHRAVRRHHQQGAALRDRRHTHRLRHQGEQDAVRSARGRGLSHRRHSGSSARATA